MRAAKLAIAIAVTLIAATTARAEDRFEKTFSRSLSSSWIESGRPKRTARSRANVRPSGVVGWLAASRAVSWPGPV